MKETPLSTCERNFITQTVKQNQRLDGRKNNEFRAMTINFGADWGSALVALGETKVLAQVSCELGLPKATRPNEGMLYLNVELGPMAAPHLEAGRNSELNVQINRTLERTFKDSRCVDLESLCVTAEERVWILRVDLNALNNEGNLIDCCSIAALCALAHFKRPDVSIVDGNQVKIHTAAEKEPIPMVLHHYPVCISYATFDDGRIAVSDPTAMEERTAESAMVFGLNSFRELCCLNLGGTTLTSAMLLLQCAKRAASRAHSVVESVKQALELDRVAREDAGKSGSIAGGFTECLRRNQITTLAEDRLALRLRHFNFKDIEECDTTGNRWTTTSMKDQMDENDEVPEDVRNKTKPLNKDVAKSASKWMPEDDDDDAEDANIVDIDSDNEAQEAGDSDDALAKDVENALLHANQRSNQPISKQRRHHRLHEQKNTPQEAASSDSEEEGKMVL